MIRLGITGSIGMGKSTVAKLFAAEGVPVFCSDDAVHELLGPGGEAVPAVLARFPGTGEASGGIDRRLLGKAVFDNDTAMKALEALLHPRVRDMQAAFYARHRRNASGIVGFDIPLLYETGAERRLDHVVVATAPYWLQRRRVLARPGMTEEKFHAILRRQMPDAEKRKMADFVVHTGRGLGVSKRQVLAIMAQVKQ